MIKMSLGQGCGVGAGSSEPELFSRILKEPAPVNESHWLRLQPAPGKIEKKIMKFQTFPKSLEPENKYNFHNHTRRRE